VCDNPETALSVIGYILGKEIGMSNSSSDKPSESKRRQLEYSNPDGSKPEEKSDYYYDDATGYEIYEDEDDEEDDASEN
jgi:hypothetical protein